MALVATAEYYDATDVAIQILPHLVLNAGDSVVLPTTVTGSTTTGLLGFSNGSACCLTNCNTLILIQIYRGGVSCISNIDRWLGRCTG
ncbi:unnamed protein product [Sphagnum tenellum]